MLGRSGGGGCRDRLLDTNYQILVEGADPGANQPCAASKGDVSVSMANPTLA
jgi:hypothetical protein